MPEWLTYAQAGSRFGTSAEAIRLRARRFGWRTQPGNDGRTLVQVPDDVTVQPPSRPDGQPPGRTPGQSAEIARLTAQLTAADERADRADKLAYQAEQRADRAKNLADAANIDRRAADARAGAAEADRRAADARADAAAVRADEAHADRRDAEGRAQRAEDRTAELRDRINVLQVQLATAEADGNALTIETAELTAQLNQAVRSAQEAQEVVEELRRTEAARAGQGRWARLRRAWQEK
jgi:chromosome segregation ATPase